MEDIRDVKREIKKTWSTSHSPQNLREIQDEPSIERTPSLPVLYQISVSISVDHFVRREIPVDELYREGGGGIAVEKTWRGISLT